MIILDTFPADGPRMRFVSSPLYEMEIFFPFEGHVVKVETGLVLDECCGPFELTTTPDGLLARFPSDLLGGWWYTNASLLGGFDLRVSKGALEYSRFADICTLQDSYWAECDTSTLHTPAVRIEIPEPQLFLAALFATLLLVWRRR